MKLYVIAATIGEIEPLIETTINTDYKLIITGVGAMAATYQLTKMIREDKPDLIIQAGLAGSFEEGLSLGSVVVVNRDRFADLGVEENSKWIDIYDLGLAQANEEPFKDGWLRNENKSLNRFGYAQVSSITINEITTMPKRISLLREKYNASIESMEGAALHYVCLLEKIPFIQLRAISNRVGERDKGKWKIKPAIENLNNALIKIMENAAL